MSRGTVHRRGRYEFRGYCTWPGDRLLVNVGRFACRINHGYAWRRWILIELRLFGYGFNIFLSRHEQTAG